MMGAKKVICRLPSSVGRESSTFAFDWKGCLLSSSWNFSGEPGVIEALNPAQVNDNEISVVLACPILIMIPAIR